MTIIFLAICLIAIAAAFVAIKAKNAEKNEEKPAKGFEVRARIPVTEQEQKMFWRIKEDLPEPEFVVLAQVAFSALMTSRRQSDRNQFNRKRADFVICNKAFRVLAVVELDDASHKEEGDQSRDAMLKAAGFKVLRYRGIPNAGVVKADVLKLAEKKS